MEHPQDVRHDHRAGDDTHECRSYRDSRYVQNPTACGGPVLASRYLSLDLFLVGRPKRLLSDRAIGIGVRRCNRRGERVQDDVEVFLRTRAQAGVDDELESCTAGKSTRSRVIEAAQCNQGLVTIGIGMGDERESARRRPARPLGSRTPSSRGRTPESGTSAHRRRPRW